MLGNPNTVSANDVAPGDNPNICKIMNKAIITNPTLELINPIINKMNFKYRSSLSVY